MRGRSLALFIGFTLIGTAVLLALGGWQWQRRTEKRAFIARIAEAAAQVPKPLHEARIWDRVTVSGRFDPRRSVFIRTSRPAPKPGERDSRGQVPVSGFGVMVISLFHAEFCDTDACSPREILINRGFLPTPPSGEIPALSVPSGRVTLTGFLRPSEREGLFPPHNDPSKGVYFFRTTEQIARSFSVGRMLPDGKLAHPALMFMASVDVQAEVHENASPYGIDAADMLRSIPNNHLEYAITWWSLAATNVVVAVFFLASKRRRRDENAVT